MAFDVSHRGLKVLYRPGSVNFCPGCGRAHWYVGRFSAECGFCGTALPLVETGRLGSGAAHRASREDLLRLTSKSRRHPDHLGCRTEAKMA